MLSSVACRNAKPRDKAYKLADSHGLALEVKPNGTKVWRYRYEMVIGDRRRERLFTIGSFAVAPAVEDKERANQRRAGGQYTLQEARAERDRARGLVRQGRCPAQERRLGRFTQERQATETVEVVAAEWLKTKDWGILPRKQRISLLRRAVFP